MSGPVLGRAAALLLRALGATWRIRTDGPDPLVPGHPPVIGAMWHRNVLIAAFYYRHRSYGVAVSRSRDGERIASLLDALGYAPPARGSSTRGGAAALRRLVRQVRAGTTVSIQTDGPQGPARVSKPGIVSLARLSGRPITPVAFAARPRLRFRSWDGTLLPLPFARVHCRYGEPLRVPPDADEDESERLRAALDEALSALDASLQEPAASGP